MSEVPHLTPSLPQFSGSLDYWQADVDNLTQAWEKGHGHDFQAQLPEVIGQVPDAERAALSEWRPSFRLDTVFAHVGSSYYAELEEAFPGTLALIKDDIAVVTQGSARLQMVEIDKRLTAAGRFARGSGAIHIDSSDSIAEAGLPSYIVSDLNPTRFLEGKARMGIGKNGMSLRKNSVDPVAAKRVVPAQPFALVRMSGATVHQSPKFDVAQIRTFVSFRTEPK